jgi:hypothetical protein
MVDRDRRTESSSQHRESCANKAKRHHCEQGAAEMAEPGQSSDAGKNAKSDRNPE